MLIKIYYPNPTFPQGGRMTLGFSELTVGDTVELKGPIGHFVWKGKGVAFLNGKERPVRKIGAVCGGSGITPILQVLRGILSDDSDGETHMSVLDANRYEDDILCREELDQLAAEHPSQFQLRYTLTGSSPTILNGWKHLKGRIDEVMLRTYLPKPAEDRLVCICGPPQMEHAIKGALTRIGWDPSSQIIIF